MSALDPIAAYQRAEHRLAESVGVEVQESRVPVPGFGQVRVLAAGQGEPVLFVHGGGAAAAIWLPLLAHLVDRQLVALDRPGCGLSGGFSYERVPFRPHTTAVLDAVIDSLGGRVDIVANSMGGLWSLWFALDQPSRVRSMVQLGTPALFADTGLPAPLRLVALPGVGALLAKLERPSPRQVERLLGRLGHRDDLEAGRLSAELIAWWVTLQRLPWYQRSWRSLLRVAARLLRDGAISDQELEQLACPTLFLWSVSDPFGSPDQGRPLIERMPSSRLQLVPGGHLPWLGDPAGSAREIDRFLSDAEVRR